MDTQILDSIAKEPPLLRWLHIHDPDRNLTQELLAASGSIHSQISQAPASTAGSVPSTSSLFVPMYRRKHFVLGQLYGPMSPNVQGLAMLAAAGYGYGSVPTPVSRRFVADLSLPTLDFLEYEWLSDGKLCVTIHHIRTDGLYHGQTILLDSAESSSSPSQIAASSEEKSAIPSKAKINTPLTSHDLIASPFRPVPTKVVMRTDIIERPGCQQCYENMQICQCATPVKPRQSSRHFHPPTNWDSWIRAMEHTRKDSNIQLSMRFSIVTPSGVFSNSKDIIIHQDFEVGVEQKSPQSNLLLRMFMQSSDMLVSHPTTDSTCRSEEERRQRIRISTKRCAETNTNFSTTRNAVVGDTIRVKSEGAYCVYTQSANPSFSVEGHTTAELSGVKKVLNLSTSGVRDIVRVDVDVPLFKTGPDEKQQSSKSSQSDYELPKTFQSQKAGKGMKDMGLESKCSSMNLMTSKNELPDHSAEATVSNNATFSSALAFSSPAILVAASAFAPYQQISTPPITSVDVKNTNEVLASSKELLPKKQSTSRKKVFTCECGKIFKHRGHYNEHRHCVHEKVRQHKCAFIHCQRYVDSSTFFT